MATDGDLATQGTRFSDFASVGRAIAILETLSGERDGLRVTDLAAATGLGKTTVFRVLSSLKASGYVHQDAVSSRYSLTFKIVTLSYRYLAVHELNDICMPVLHRLAKQTGELVRLAAVDGEELRWISQAEGNLNRIRLSADIGQAVSLHASATGKAWLSTLPEDEALRVALTRGLDARTPESITTAERLLQELRLTRERGYALALEEGDVGVRAVAVPVRHPETPLTAPAVGTISVAGTVLNLDESRLRSFVPSLDEAAREVAPFWLGFFASPHTLRSQGGLDDRGTPRAETLATRTAD